MRRQHKDSGEAYEDIDDAGSECFLAPKQQHPDIPLEDSDQKPVETADDQKRERNIMECFHDWINGSNNIRPFDKYIMEHEKEVYYKKRKVVYKK